MGFFSRHSEFYDFVRGTQHFRVTTDTAPLVYAGQTYAPLAGMKRSAIVLTQELEKAALQITVPYTFELLAIFRPTPPMQVVSVAVYRLPKGDTTAACIWSGVIIEVEDADESSASIHCAGGLATMTNNGLRRKCQRACPLRLYGSGLGQCNKDRSTVRTDGVLSLATATTIKAAGFATKPDGWFDGGLVEWSIGVATERRFVVSHIGDTLQLLTPCALAAGQVVAAYPGCDHTAAGGCTKLDNLVNYGGQLYIPLKNPMGNDPIY